MTQEPCPSIRISEVGPRDGLQNEAKILSVAEKAAFVDQLCQCGIQEVEVGSFVRPDLVPQMASTAEVFKAIRRFPGVSYSALVPNLRGLDSALEAMVDKVGIFTSASEGFAQANIRSSIQESIDRFKDVVTKAQQSEVTVRAYVSCVIACPYDGPTPVENVRRVCDSLLELGVDELDLGDTIGVADPDAISRLYEGLSGICLPSESVLHLHNTNGRALDCARRALELGVQRFDSSCGGLGGCPFAPGASGNLATEDLIEFLDDLAEPTGLDAPGLRALGSSMQARLQPSTGCD